jgi:hypothetical protein
MKLKLLDSTFTSATMLNNKFFFQKMFAYCIIRIFLYKYLKLTFLNLRSYSCTAPKKSRISEHERHDWLRFISLFLILQLKFTGGGSETL